MLSVDKFKMLRFYKGTNAAIVTPFNGKIRVYEAEGNTETFYSELTNAVKYLVNNGYFIEYLFNTCYKYPEDNRV